MSEDLDFTLKSQSSLNDKFLTSSFLQVSKWVYDACGLVIPENKIELEFYTNPRGRTLCEGKLSYLGPITPTSHKQTPRIKIDLTIDEIIVEQPVLKSIDHGYSDKPMVDIRIPAYSYLEIFSEKIQALSERARPRDLYDVIHFFRRRESEGLASEIKRVLEKKCTFKDLPFPTLSALEKHKLSCATGWHDQLSRQIPVLPVFDLFWKELGQFFDWLQDDGAKTDKLPKITDSDKIEVDIMSLDLDSKLKSFLVKLLFASTNRLCVEVTVFQPEIKKKTKIIIAPYSLRRSNENILKLYVINMDNKEKLALHADKISSLNVLSTAFDPAYEIDFIPKII